jgi:tetratricopeptide (TPR) repeat protein
MMFLRRAIIAVIVLLVGAGLASAQFQGRVSGQVLDESGQPVEKAEITIVSQKSSALRYELKTDREGKFVQIGIQPGYFLITAKKSGFAPASLEVHVGVAGEEVVELKLRSAEAAVAKTYSDADKQFLKGNKLFAEQKYLEAAGAFEAAIGLDPANWAYHLNLGLARKKASQAPEAQAAFLKAAELNPGSYSANKEAGEALAKEGKFGEAKPFYEKAVELSPDDPDGQYNLGVCLVNLGEPEAALARFEKAVELKPEYAEAHYQMGTILIGQNKTAEAIASLEKFLALDPGSEKAGIARQLLDFLKKK